MYSNGIDMITTTSKHEKDVGSPAGTNLKDCALWREALEDLLCQMVSFSCWQQEVMADGKRHRAAVVSWRGGISLF